MSFIDALNVRGEVQTVPAHFLTEFPDQFKPVLPESAPKPTTPPAKAATTKES
jgi:hypothetical protein